ncbi:hypothetical protein [Candidatus Binatus sp.]|uniref:hypothetical protein n=1 Tax=Candidatus Binatus sp. TaxID=2811406 RepID=UPI003CC525B0
MKNSLVCALALVLLGAAGCASQTQSAPAPSPAPAAAAPQSTPAPVEVRTNLEFGGPQVSIFHPDTRTLYLWSSDPRPGPPHRAPNCIKIQMSDSPSGGPVTNEPCS